MGIFEDMGILTLIQGIFLETKEDNLLVGKETSSSSNGDQLRSQKSEIEEKQAIIQQNRDFLEQLVDVKGKEMAARKYETTKQQVRTRYCSVLTKQ